jgi:hypothetical protein
MTDKDLLSTVQPADGWFAVVGIKGRNVVQKFKETREEVDQLVKRYVAEGRDVYFGVAKYATPDNRTKDNVKSLRSFWLDIDCGEGKAIANPTTGRPDGYIDQQAGVRALGAFCELVGLPKPTLVNSGRGIHAYWPLTRDISRGEWEPVAARLLKLCTTQDLYVDNSVFEVARILRVPGTLNFKDDPPKPVTVLHYADPLDYEELCDLLGVDLGEEPQAEDKTEKPADVPQIKRELSDFAKSMIQNTVANFGKIMRRSISGTGCNQLLDAYKTRDTLPEPRWFDALSIAKFCNDKETAIHNMSQGHEDYDYNATEYKIQHILGPHTCSQFEKHNPGGCEGCPHRDKIKSPILLGKEVVAATEEDSVIVEEPAVGSVEPPMVHKIPEYPFPFVRGKTGGVYFIPQEEEVEPVCVYENDLYVTKRMRDPNVGDVVVIKVHMPQDGVKEFIVANTDATDPNELRKALSFQGVITSPKKFKLLADYIHASIKDLQHRKKAELMRLQFGWADRDSKFIIGDREVSKEGIYHSPPSSVTKATAAFFEKAGSYEKWREVFALYGTPGLEPHAFAALTAFGSPLLKFTGQSGAMINLINPMSGTGKTTILHMINSVYGNPDKIGATAKDTIVAKILLLGIMCNLPYTIDEMTNMGPEAFSDLIYSISQGRDKNRGKGSTNELRINSTTWNTIAIASSNSSFAEKLTKIKRTPDGETMRLLEYPVGFRGALDVAYAKNMFDRQLLENYGHAGDIYASYLVNNLEDVKSLLSVTQKKIDLEMKLTQRERFWSAIVACNITGGILAKRIGLIDWDLKAIYSFATALIEDLRTTTAPPVMPATDVVGSYCNRYCQNILSTHDELDARTNLAMQPMREPRGELLIRHEIDTQKIYILAKSFKDYCIDSQTNYRDTLKELGDLGLYIGAEKKRMSKGMPLVSLPVHALVFDNSNNKLVALETLENPADDSGGG